MQPSQSRYQLTHKITNFTLSVFVFLAQVTKQKRSSNSAKEKRNYILASVTIFTTYSSKTTVSIPGTGALSKRAIA